MKEYASDQSRILVADLSEMNRREIKQRIAFKIWTADWSLAYSFMYIYLSSRIILILQQSQGSMALI